jgi:phosphatidylglycerophosphate synthase
VAAGLLTDGADGWLARHRGTASEFGSRFDMETDALFMLTLSLLVHALGEIGGWVLLSGLLRYLFVGAGLLWSPLTAPLLPSFRRKSVCGVQMAILVAALAPSMPAQWGSALCAVALSLLIYSFSCDVLWLALTSGATCADDLPAVSLHHHATASGLPAPRLRSKALLPLNRRGLRDDQLSGPRRTNGPSTLGKRQRRQSSRQRRTP